MDKPTGKRNPEKNHKGATLRNDQTLSYEVKPMGTSEFTKPCITTLCQLELRPILHIHLHSQTSKNLHLRFDLGRADHPERVK